jgi:endonuclease/exonuclease/phosphatase (EEP) superfamily protein YafD
MGNNEALVNLFFVIGYCLVIISLLPLVKSNQWFIRIFDYPRSQKFWINAAILVVFVFVFRRSSYHHMIFGGVLVINQLYLLSLIWNYTPLASIQMKKNVEANADIVRIYIANVFQDNRDYEACFRSIEKVNPDLVLLVETDQEWCAHVKNYLQVSHPYTILQPQDNTYGMILFSKFEIAKSEIRFLIENDIPSMVADIKSKGGKIFRMYALHPKPPVPHESDESTERDAEILMIGKEAKKCKLPVIVAGDLNDVAWSYTTNLFLKISGLLDPRIGRGFFNTFHANYKLMRWPLDHVFCSTHFYLHDIQRLPTIGSDHFPIFIQVCLMPEEVEENKEATKEPDASDIKMANEKIKEAM